MNKLNITLPKAIGYLLAIISSIILVLFTFIDNWASKPLDDMPPIFWIGIAGEFGTLAVIRGLDELKAWRSGQLNGKERQVAPMLVIGLFLLFVSALGSWLGVKVVLLLLGICFTLWGGSAVLRERKFTRITT